MDNVVDLLKQFPADPAAAITAIVGAAMYFLMWSMMIDFLTGFPAAIVTKQVSSKIGSVGLARKAQVLLVMLLLNVFERTVPGNPPISVPVAYAFALIEFTSILENLQRSGVPLPAQLVNVLYLVRNLSARSSLPLPQNDQAAITNEDEQKKNMA